MSRPQCPVCRARLSALSILRAPTPLHLRCGECRTPLRVRGPIEPVALAVGVAMGAVIGVRVVWYGLIAEAPLVLGMLLGYELLAAVWILTFGELERRS